MQSLKELKSRDELWRAGGKILQTLYSHSCFKLSQDLLCFIENIDKLTLVTQGNIYVSDDNKKKYISFLERLLMNEPLSKITGKNEFYGEEFFVTNDTLDPREDSHILIEAVLESVTQDDSYSILDIGTGTGCLAIILAKNFIKSQIIGLDISEQAIIMANKNATALSVVSNCSFFQQDIFSLNSSDFFSKLGHLKKIQKQSFDIILSNPPYIPTGALSYLDDMVSLYDPRIALDGGDDGLDFYRQIIKLLPFLANENSKIFFEFGVGQGACIREMLSEIGCADFKFFRDEGYVIRVISCSFK